MDYSKYIHRNMNTDIDDLSLYGILDRGFFDMRHMSLNSHIHIMYELHAAISGRYYIEDCDSRKQYEMTGGNLLLIPPNRYHVCMVPDAQDTHARKLALRFSIQKNGAANVDSIYAEIERTISAMGMPMIWRSWECTSLLQSVRNELLSDQPGHIPMAEARFRQFGVLLFRALLSSERQNDQPDAVYTYKDNLQDKNNLSAIQDKIMLYLDYNYHKPITMQNLAENLNMSPRQLHRLFAKYYNTTFHETLTDIRMRHAERLLEQTDSTVESIAERIGYTTPSTFYTAFLKKHQITPREYRRRMRGTC